MRFVKCIIPFLLAVGCGGGETTVSVTPVPPFVVFSTQRHGNEEIYRTDSVGKYIQRLTDDASTDHQPAFSAENSKIVFVSDRNGNDDIFSVNGDGSSLRRLTTDLDVDNCPRFNASGTQIVFQRGQSVVREIWVMNANGSNPKRVTNNGFNDSEPGWTPDGRIVFTSTRSGVRQIYRMDATGANVEQLTTDPAAECYQADYKADGSQIAFILKRNGRSRAHLMNPDGTGIVDRGHGGEEFWPRWSPDGSRLVVTAVANNNEDVYRMNPDGSGWVKLTNTAFADGHGDW